MDVPTEFPERSFVRGSKTCRILNADCLSGIRHLIPPGSIDVVVTSPPYNLGTTYATYDDAIPRGDYLDWTEQWTGAVAGTLAKHGSLFLNVGGKPSDPTVAVEVLGRAQKHLQLQNVIHWIKSIAIEAEDLPVSYGGQRDPARSLSIGHYKPIQSPRYLNDCHEYIFHLTRKGDVPLDRLAVGVEYKDKSNVGRWSGGRDRRCRGNIWFIPYKTIRSRALQRPHPATFPVKIPRMCIQLHGVRPDLTVLDPFLGLGASAIAAIELGVNFIGFEIDDLYFAEAGRLLESAGRSSGREPAEPAPR